MKGPSTRLNCIKLQINFESPPGTLIKKLNLANPTGDLPCVCLICIFFAPKMLSGNPFQSHTTHAYTHTHTRVTKTFRHFACN